MNSPTRALVTVAAIVVIAAGLKASQEVVVPILLAAFIATIAAPPVFWLERRRIPEGLAIIGVMVTVVVALIGVAMLVVRSGNAFTDRLPFYQQRITELMGELVTWLSSWGLNLNGDVALSAFNPATALDLAGNLLKGLGGVMSDSFFILLTVIFILAEASSFPRKLAAVLKNPDRDMGYFNRFGENINRYIAIKTSTSLVTGVLVSISLMLIGVDFPVLWGLVAFLLNYVPTIGSFIAAVPAVLLALIALGGGAALATTGCYLFINILMGNVIEPRYMGKGLGLSTLVVFLSLVAWGALLGPVGMFLSVPLTMTAKIALEAHPSTTWLAHLLGPADAASQLNVDGDQGAG
jgi:predicted PurR-regulated permease PerM